MEVPLADPTVAMPDQLPIFETHLKKRGRTWKWYVCTTEGQLSCRGRRAGGGPPGTMPIARFC